MTKLFTIKSKGEGYTATVFALPDGGRQFTGDMDIDIDGSPKWHTDPYGQPDTTLHHEGKPINSSLVAGIVLPPECIKEPKGVVLGCKCECEYLGIVVPGVVFDIGPHSKLGEASPAMASALGINPDPNKGGIDKPVVTYRYWPGVPAVVNGIQYELHPYYG